MPGSFPQLEKTGYLKRSFQKSILPFEHPSKPIKEEIQTVKARIDVEAECLRRGRYHNKLQRLRECEGV